MDLKIDISTKSKKSIRTPYRGGLCQGGTMRENARAALCKRKVPVNSIRGFAGYTMPEIRSPRSASSQDLVQGNPFNEPSAIWS